MATITIRNLDETVKRKLQVRAALHGRSMEAEARQIITDAVAGMDLEQPRKGLGTLIHERFAEIGGADDLEISPRTKSHRPIPTFDE